ncbi:unnamed protein product [Cylindrotheca closterium]|uniref:Phospholipase A-2-activating protein n=1 Tax=Cylindrotheca closterium TaxID=2856 RepID=A0AAD2PXL5_9STRA|nr:unnamed protein product [Cylindrotheca closterium]
MQADWELSQQFISDSQGIRAACPLASSNQDSDEFMLVTGNQGGGLCEFGITSSSLNPISYQHNHAITAILSTSEPEAENQRYITGCKDAMIRVFSRQHELMATLKGHEKTVSSLAFASTSENKQFLVSGSWDGTAKVWDLERQMMVATLPGHENTVSVTGLTSKDPNYLQIATGSAGIAQGNMISGHTVRIWSVDVKTSEVSCLKKVANDHEGPIRNILALNETCLATCSNDGTVKLRSPETGTALSTLQFVPQQQQQHPPMLLSVAKAGEDSIVASAEDGHVVVFNLQGAGEPQILLHPACVWNVVGLPNGDICTCCDDGTLRVFTLNSDRMAPLQERETYAQLVQEAHQKKGSGPTPEEIAKLPLWEQNLQVRGNSEGQVHVFNKGGVAIAAQWSAASQSWVEVGQVMGNAGDGGAIDGVTYDHVYPIEVDQTGGGVAKLQIGYNNGENPFVAAQRFIDAYMLPQHHLNDIANYIQQRAGAAAPSLGGAAGAPGGSASVATTGIPMVSYQHLPMPGYKSFELSAKSAATTMEKMKAKIKGFGKLSEEQLQQIESLASTLTATSRYHASQIQAAELNAIINMLETFAPSEAFPALDLARLAVAHPHGAAESNAVFWDKVVVKALSMCQDTSTLEGPVAVAIPMLSIRLFANSFRGGPGSQLAVVGHLDDILTCVDSFVASSNKNVRLAVATLLYNIAHYIHTKAQDDSTIASRVITCADAILKARTYEAEAITRVLIAAGTVALANPQAKETAKSIFMVSRVEMSASPHGHVAKAVAKEVYNAMQ